MDGSLAAARTVITRCAWIAAQSESPGRITRTCLSAPMRAVHVQLREWMEHCGMTVSIDPAGNLRGAIGTGPRLVVGSHLDTVPDAGAYDGVLGVLIGLALAERLAGRQLPFQLEVVGFSDEEGIRFGVPFIGSRAAVGDAGSLLPIRDGDGISLRQALVLYGLDADRLDDARTDAVAYLEFHIEQGPVLDSLNLPVGVVDAIAGQSRLDVTFTGRANHAGTTPQAWRQDALAGAAEWIGAVEHLALATSGLVATVGRVTATPNVRNAINGQVIASLDIRHGDDRSRHDAVTGALREAERIASSRRLTTSSVQHLDQPAVSMDPTMSAHLQEAVIATGGIGHRLISGAGHDAMIMARLMPAAMLFLRSPGGISHHPDEAVQTEDVAAAIEVGLKFLDAWEPASA